MKKLIGLLLICTLLLSMVGCGNPQFESEEAMMNYLEGLWVHDHDYLEKVYYLFCDGVFYQFDKRNFLYETDKIFESYVDDGRIAELKQLDFDGVRNTSGIDSFIFAAERYSFLTKAGKGKIILNKGESFEKQIIVTEETVTVKEAGKAESVTLTRISEDVESIEEVLAELFEEAKGEVQIPISNLIKSAQEYAEDIKELHPETRKWILTDQSDGATIYTKNGSMSNGGGTLMIYDGEIIFTKKDVAGNNTTLMYDVNGVLDHDYQLFIHDTSYTSMESLLNNAAPLLEDIPGALSTAQILDLFEKESTVSSGSRDMEKTVDGITYKIGQATSGKNTVIYITLPDEVKIEDTAGEQDFEVQTPVVQPTEPQAPQAQTPASQTGLNLPCSWEIELKSTSRITVVQFALLQDGKCYAIKDYGSLGMEGCSGEYKIEGNILSMFMDFNAGESYEVCYEVDTQARTLKQISKIGPDERIGAEGDIYSYKDTYESPEDIAKRVPELRGY